MERLESLGNAISQITLYDIKSMYNQAKNVVFNVSEMEAKVQEATNDEPWGASSTLMQEIAQGTFNFKNFNEIMPAIYSRYMEKEAKQWRQIYKALQLLEYLIKNGSERVVDDARSHIATIKMLRNFYYIDDKGKDQGINVRNRSRELVELLSDVEKIRIERRKAKANKHKYTGVGNDAMGFTSSGSRYGGYGNDSFGYGGGSGSRSYGSGGEYSSRDYGGGFRDETPRRGFQEYDAGDDETMPRRANSITASRSAAARGSPQRSSTMPTSVTQTPKVPESAQEVDLLGMDDDAFGGPTATATAGTNKALPVVALQAGPDGDDDFDDFQTAPSSAVTNNSVSLFTSTPSAPVANPITSPLVQQGASMQPMSPMQSMSPPIHTMSPVQNLASMQALNRTGSAGVGVLSSPVAPISGRTPYMSPTAVPMHSPIFPTQPVMAPTPPPQRTNVATPSASSAHKSTASANFDDLWTMSLGGSSGSTNKAPAASAAKSIKDLEKEKVQAGIWGSGQSRPSMAAGFGSFGSPAGTPSAAAPPPSSAGGLDDLLL
ncbi:hypothetical protein AcV5_008184 [Taiwanofungus camphoratus]|nr:hypothetical protein AcV5_008184 [Antrodia cinnamomea]